MGTAMVPAGAGVPGWLVETGKARYRNPTPLGGGVRAVAMTAQRKLKVVVHSTVVPSAGPHEGRVAIRITTGSLRQCALFDGAAVRTDRYGEFVAGATAVPSATFLPDCADETLVVEPPPPPPCTDLSFPDSMCAGTCPAGFECGTTDLSTCICIDGSQPCGDTSPTCNGQCPAGEECFDTGGFPLPGCSCLPAGSIACSQFQCGGACPAGQECNSFVISTPGLSGCACGPPGPCGSGGDDCPPGFQCVGVPGTPGLSVFCAPIP